MIGERQAAILGLIIESYIKTGEPIGSKTLANLLPYKISSATIRNEMAYLSDLGFLEQIHTSGGRIPSKASYRYYVDNLMIPNPFGDSEKQNISEALSVNASDSERLLKNAVLLLASATNCAAFYNTVKDDFDCIQGVDIIPAGGSKAMVVMLTVGGKIKSSVCRLNCPVDDEFKSVFYKLTSDYFIGTPVKDVNLVFIQSAAPVLGARLFDMLPVLTSLCVLCRESAEGSLVVEGETNLLSHKELGSGVYRLLSFLAAKEQLKDYLSGFVKYGKEKELFIGDENYHPELKNAASVIAKFNYNNSQTAVLGIIGSTRIDYSSILPRTEYIMNTVKNFLQEGGVKFE
ncbi:MAG: heat-inducible transcriptional repressor HrcA [Clostridiales bacterium]|nr:heat-inducible transcriptional repressor HrcA [Clostridiales bacterium]